MAGRTTPGSRSIAGAPPNQPGWSRRRNLVLLLIAGAAAAPTHGQSGPDRVPDAADELQQITNEIFDDTTNDLPWRCVEIPGFLILSRGEQLTLAAYAREVQLESRQLAPVLPPADWMQPSDHVVPVVLFAGEPAAPGAGAARNLRRLGHVGAGVIAVNARNFGHALRSPDARGSPRLKFLQPIVAAYHEARLAEPRPPPPRWLSEGLSFFWRMSQHEPDALVLPRMFVGDGRREVPANSWTTLEYPMRDVFTNYATFDTTTVERDPRRRAHLSRQSWLFVRWALLGDEARRTAFWAFARDATTDPPSEEVLEKHFGMSFAELDAVLTDWLVASGGALPEGRVATPRRESPAGEAEVRNATREEIDSLHRALLDAMARLRR